MPLWFFLALFGNLHNNTGGVYLRSSTVIRELDHITVNPQICLGQPTIRGMGITVGFVLKLLASQLS
ncbi:MAG: DUF433 domain-containing protein, partial [Microcystis panniformis]